MDLKIGVVATYKNFTKLAENVSKKMDTETIIDFGTLNDGIVVGEKLISEYGVDALISRGKTGRLIEKNIDKPIIVIEITNFDLIKAFNKAKNMGKKVLFIDAYRDKYYYQIDVVQDILKIKVDVKTFKELDEIPVLLEEGYRNGNDIVVATAECVIAKARKINLNGIMIETTEEDFEEAIMRVRNIVNLNRKEAKNVKLFNTMLSNVDEGIIIIDNLDNVKMFNKYALDMFNIKSDNVIEKNIYSIKQFSQNLIDIASNRTETIGEIIHINNNEVVINTIPMFIGEKYLGLYIKLQKIVKMKEIENKVRKNLYKEKGFFAKATFDDIIGKSESISMLKEEAKIFSKFDVTVLIIGESGTGKELFAQSIHNESRRKKEPFVAINCAALSESLLESELFGYDEGAFTGAKKGGKMGLVELAHLGTLFLDEIGDISLALQAKLLRVIQEKEVMRIGGNSIIPVDVRIICATNRNLREKLTKGEFREDFYHRINAVEIIIPPLRTRKEDIPLIAKHLIKMKNSRYNLNSDLDIDDWIYNEILKYDWPGNVRELDHFVDKYMILTDSSRDENTSLDMKLFYKLLLNDIIYGNNNIEYNNINIKEQLSDNEITITLGPMDYIKNQIIDECLERYEGNKTKVSEILGISRTNLWRNLRERIE